jgi:hypothetical protein
MKKLRIWLLALTVLAFGMLLSGCKVDPAKEEWHLQGYIKNTAFMGGVEREIIYGNATVEYPYAGVSSEKTNIAFTEDGKVRFSTCDGEILEGTYAFDPVFNLTFSNGEKAEGKCSTTLLGGSRMEFVFRGVTYYFSPNETRQFRGEAELIKDLRWDTNPYLCDANVEIDGEAITVTYKGGAVWQVTDTTAVYAMHLNEGNQLIPLDTLREGKCRMAYVKQEDYFVLYYIEPLASDTCLLADVETWVKGIKDADVAKITVIEEYAGTDNRMETAVTDAAGIKHIMDMLRQTKITKIPAGQVTLEEKAQILNIVVTTKDNTVMAVKTYGNYFVIGSDYWKFDNFIDPDTVK